MSERRGNGNGAGHYRGEGAHTDPTENVKELVTLQALRQAEATAALALRLDQRDKIREVHRLELAEKDAEIQAKETQRINAINAVEKARVDATFGEQRQATALAETSRRAEQAAIAKEVATTANALAAQTAAQVGGKEQRSETRQTSAALYALVGFIISLLMFGMAAVAFIIARANP